jgi:hypothetical protein
VCCRWHLNPSVCFPHSKICVSMDGCLIRFRRSLMNYNCLVFTIFQICRAQVCLLRINFTETMGQSRNRVIVFDLLLGLGLALLLPALPNPKILLHLLKNVITLQYLNLLHPLKYNFVLNSGVVLHLTKLINFLFKFSFFLAEVVVNN